MKLDHGDARVWILVAFVTVAGLAAYRFIPRYHLAAGAATAGIIALLVLKHVGLLGAFGAPAFGYFRTRFQERMSRRRA